MSKIRIGVTLLLAIIVLVLIGYNSGINQRRKPSDIDNDQPTYQSQQTVTTVYHPDGKLHYKLVAKDAQNYAHDYVDDNADNHARNATPNVTSQPVTWFSQLVMTLFDENAVGSWMIKADRAKLTDDKILYLYGHVEVNSLTANSQLQKIETNNAQINLINKDVSSDDEVTLYGIGFTANGMKMRGNLRSQTAELIEKVKTYYEIQK